MHFVASVFRFRTIYRPRSTHTPVFHLLRGRLFRAPGIFLSGLRANGIANAAYWQGESSSRVEPDIQIRLPAREAIHYLSFHITECQSSPYSLNVLSHSQASVEACQKTIQALSYPRKQEKYSDCLFPAPLFTLLQTNGSCSTDKISGS